MARERLPTCLITVHSRTLQGVPEGLTVEVKADYDACFIEALKRLAHHRERHYDPQEKTWFFREQVLGQLVVAAKRHYERAYMVRDLRTTNLHTGREIEQVALFGEEGSL